ncbi:carbon-phosphorus lyase [Salipiger aestuarii]|uniref:Alpha-D-ribose 1-methylphosphonate 5-triphosphate synthase subunit PhnH n=1 Tax=Salipiger aestuarii TaxID=568098 RepID=A0A327YY52_9RHOB|nr:phosphonate C-P lyase system protein PhnH [Salipiger aestuarii]EIE49244.1 carbon-phosphorus lyase complex subunit [Citreicella sp. 357]KAA8609763.1 carbon-phosphorus lyase [Salipiger aestuarii]KAA8614094.1 carbon-phosphorus lyase [Salipiger aestuarii]KAB2543611.1 carbon-phosphorus lyase [Salipiger aestuarii]RAK22839.1 alpha-D-ribose 1-methylphosphonate 5-triphosphate synthase subunit PhnH [Salipiger aestuarii]
MQTDALTGGFGDAPVQAARAFRAALEAMARPGTLHEVTGAEAPAPVGAAAAVLLLTLCDAQTPLYLAPGHDVAAVRDWIAFHVGAPIVAAEDAAVVLGRWQALAPLDRYRIGTPDYPDRSVLLIGEVDALSAQGARLTGPGIETHAHLSLPEIEVFRANAALFPLGWDCFFTCGTRLAALPRSTKVEPS